MNWRTEWESLLAKDAVAFAKNIAQAKEFLKQTVPIELRYDPSCHEIITACKKGARSWPIVRNKYEDTVPNICHRRCTRCTCPRLEVSEWDDGLGGPSGPREGITSNFKSTFLNAWSNWTVYEDGWRVITTHHVTSSWGPYYAMDGRVAGRDGTYHIHLPLVDDPAPRLLGMVLKQNVVPGHRTEFIMHNVTDPLVAVEMAHAAFAASGKQKQYDEDRLNTLEFSIPYIDSERPKIMPKAKPKKIPKPVIVAPRPVRINSRSATTAAKHAAAWRAMKELQLLPPELL